LVYFTDRIFFGVVGWCKKPTGKVTPMCRKVALPFAPLLVLNVCASWETFLNLKNTFDWWIPGARSQRSAGGTCQDALRVFVPRRLDWNLVSHSFGKWQKVAAAQTD